MNLAVGDNRPRLVLAMTAAQALGGVPVPLYQDAVAAEMAYVLEDAEITFAVVEDREQVDSFAGARGTARAEGRRGAPRDLRGPARPA